MNNTQQITDKLLIDMDAAPRRCFGQSLRIDWLTLRPIADHGMSGTNVCMPLNDVICAAGGAYSIPVGPVLALLPFPSLLLRNPCREKLRIKKANQMHHSEARICATCREQKRCAQYPGL
jgi:hypothetical protein